MIAIVVSHHGIHSHLRCRHKDRNREVVEIYSSEVRGVGGGADLTCRNGRGPSPGTEWWRCQGRWGGLASTEQHEGEGVRLQIRGEGADVSLYIITFSLYVTWEGSRHGVLGGMQVLNPEVV